MIAAFSCFNYGYYPKVVSFHVKYSVFVFVDVIPSKRILRTLNNLFSVILIRGQATNMLSSLHLNITII